MRSQRQAEQWQRKKKNCEQTSKSFKANTRSYASPNGEQESQRGILRDRNAELEEARHRLQAKAEELSQMSTYESQFLANMSHELRAPLDSMLLLSQLLAQSHVKDSLSPRVRAQIPPPSTIGDLSLPGVTLLLAEEDDMRTVYALSALLTSKGATGLVADTELEALDLLATNPRIDAVLMDIMTPAMDGYEATRRQRQAPRFRNMPVIALTAKAMKGERERCLEAGASDYLTKPIESDKLLKTVQAWLRRGGAHAGGK